MDIPSYVVTAVVGALGVAAAWGAMRVVANRNTKDITKLNGKVDNISTKFVPHTECSLRHGNVAESLDEVKESVVEQKHTTKRLYNFAIYQMIENGMSLQEAQETLENGNT